MTGGVKKAVETIVGSLQSVDKKAETSGAAALDHIGDKVLGPTAESETNNAPTIAPDATITPITQGRRSRHPDGSDPFRSDAPASAPAPASAAAKES